MSIEIESSEGVDDSLKLRGALQKYYMHEYEGGEWLEAQINNVGAVVEDDHVLGMRVNIYGIDSETSFAFDNDSMWQFDAVCDYFGVPTEDYELLVGENIWVAVEDLTINDGEVTDKSTALVFEPDKTLVQPEEPEPDTDTSSNSLLRDMLQRPDWDWISFIIIFILVVSAWVITLLL